MRLRSSVGKVAFLPILWLFLEFVTPNLKAVIQILIFQMLSFAAVQVIILFQSTLCLVAEKNGRKLIAILNMCFHCFEAEKY